MCNASCCLLSTMIVNNRSQIHNIYNLIGTLIIDENQEIARKEGVIELVLNAINNHIDNPFPCRGGYNVLYAISQENPLAQSEICKKGGIELLTKVSDKHSNNEQFPSLSDEINYLIDFILSSED